MRPSPMILAGIFIVLFVLFQFYTPIAENIGKISPVYIAYGLLVAVLIISIKLLKWHMLLGQIERHGFRSSIATYFPGQLVNEFAPTGAGDLTKAYLIRRNLKTAGGSAIAVPYIERAIDILVLSSIAIVSVLFLFSSSFSLYTGIMTFVIVLLSVIFLSLAIFPRRIAGLLEKIIDVMARPNISFLKKTCEKAKGFISVLASDFQKALNLYKNRKKIIALSVAVSLTDWFLEGLCLLFLIKAAGYDIPLLPSVGIVAISWIAGIASMLPGGLGVREIVLSSLYSLYGVPFSSAFLATIIYRLIIFVFFGAGTIMSLHIMKRKPITMQSAQAIMH